MDELKKNILIIIHHLCRGGSEKSAAKLSAFLAKDNNVFVATFFDEQYYPTTYTTKGEIIRLNQSPSNGVANSISNFRDRIKFIKKIKADHKIDISISFLKSGDIINVLTKKNEQIIIGIRSSIIQLFSGKLQHLLYTFICKKADKIVLQNQENKYALTAKKKSLGEKISVIPNFYNIDEIRGKREQKSVDITKTNEQILLHIGTLYHVKGQLLLFRILKQLLTEGHQVKLVLLGGDVQKEKYFQFCRDLDLRPIFLDAPVSKIDFSIGDVFYLGFAANPYEYFKLCDLFTFSSLYEGFPNALAEAMICGSCVVSTDCKVGPKELISTFEEKEKEYPVITNRGVLMPVFKNYDIKYDDPISEEELLWIKQISELLKNPKLRHELGQNAAKWMQQFDESLVKHKWEKLINA